MLSICYALASIAKPISCNRLRRLCRLHHKGTESVPDVSLYCAAHYGEEGDEIYIPSLLVS